MDYIAELKKKDRRISDQEFIISELKKRINSSVEISDARDKIINPLTSILALTVKSKNAPRINYHVQRISRYLEVK